MRASLYSFGGAEAPGPGGGGLALRSQRARAGGPCFLGLGHRSEAKVVLIARLRHEQIQQPWPSHWTSVTPTPAQVGRARNGDTRGVATRARHQPPVMAEARSDGRSEREAPSFDAGDHVDPRSSGNAEVRCGARSLLRSPAARWQQYRRSAGAGRQSVLSMHRSTAATEASMSASVVE